jgi:hypothetical protein
MLNDSPFTEVKMVGVGGISGVLVAMVAPLVAPSAYVFLKKADAKVYTSSEMTFGIVGMVAGAAGSYMVIASIVDAAPAVPLVVLGTNLASGLYEYGRTLYSNAHTRILDRPLVEEQERKQAARLARVNTLIK